MISPMRSTQNSLLHHNRDICVPQGPHHHQAPGCANEQTSNCESWMRLRIRPKASTSNHSRKAARASSKSRQATYSRDQGHLWWSAQLPFPHGGRGCCAWCRNCWSRWPGVSILVEPKINIASCTFGWTCLRGQTYSLKQFSPQLSTAPICIIIATFYFKVQKYLHRSYWPVKPCGFQVEKDHSWTSALPAPSLTWHISGRQAEEDKAGCKIDDDCRARD